MQRKSVLSAICLMVVAVIIVSGCATKTQIVTLPGYTVRLPATTVTGYTTLPAITTTLPGITVTSVPLTVAPNPFLPSEGAVITTHAPIIDLLKGYCLLCHGMGGPNQFPVSPEHGGPAVWNGAAMGSEQNTGLYIVVQGSVQDHADRQADDCLTCHPLAST